MAVKLEQWNGDAGYPWRIVPYGGRSRHIAYFTDEELRDLVRQATRELGTSRLWEVPPTDNPDSIGAGYPEESI